MKKPIHRRTILSTIGAAGSTSVGKYDRRWVFAQQFPRLNEVYLEVFEDGSTALTVVFTDKVGDSIAANVQTDPSSLYSFPDEPAGTSQGTFRANDVTVGVDGIDPAYALGSEFYTVEFEYLSAGVWYRLTPVIFDEAVKPTYPRSKTDRFHVVFPTGFMYDLPRDHTVLTNQVDQELFEYVGDEYLSVPSIEFFDHPALTALSYSATFRHQLLIQDLRPEDDQQIQLSTLLDIEWYGEQDVHSIMDGVEGIIKFFAASSMSSFVAAPLKPPVGELLELYDVIHILTDDLEEVESSLEETTGVVEYWSHNEWLQPSKNAVDELVERFYVEELQTTSLPALGIDQLVNGPDTAFQQELEEYRAHLETDAEMVEEVLYEEPGILFYENTFGEDEEYWENLYSFTVSLFEQLHAQIRDDLELVDRIEEDIADLEFEGSNVEPADGASPVITLDPSVRTEDGSLLATLRGEVTDLREYDTVDRFFEWREADGDWTDTSRVTRDRPGEFEHEITIAEDTTYEYRAVMENGNNRYRAETVLFDSDGVREGSADEEGGLPSRFRPAVRETNAPIEAGEILEVTAEIENIGDGGGTQDIVLKFTHSPGTIDADVVEVDTGTVSLEPGESETVRLSYETPALTTDQEVPIYIETEDMGVGHEVMVHGANGGDQGTDPHVEFLHCTAVEIANVDRYEEVIIHISWLEGELTDAGDYITLDELGFALNESVTVETHERFSQNYHYIDFVYLSETGEHPEQEPIQDNFIENPYPKETDACREMFDWNPGEDGDETSEANPVTLSISSTNDPVQGGEFLEVTAQIENTGGSETSLEVRLIVGEDAEQVDSTTASVSVGEVESVSLGYETYPTEQSVEFPVRVETTAAADQQTVSVTAADGGGSGDTENDGSSDAQGQLSLAITATNTPVTGGEHLSVTVQAQNTGSAQVTDTVRLVVGGDQVDSTSVQLGAGGSSNLSLGYQTYAVEQDVSFSIRVAAANSGASDSQTVQVHGTG